MIPTLFGVSLVVWVILTCAPEPPIAAQAPGSEGKSTGDAGGLSQSVKVFRAQYGLDRPAVLNTYYRLTPDAVRKCLVAASPDDTNSDSLKARNDAQEQLILWGYYAVPSLVTLLDDEDPRLQESAAQWLVRSAQRVAVGAETGRIDPVTSRRNAEIIAENRILETYRWRSTDSPERRLAGKLGLQSWFHGGHRAFAAAEPEALAAVRSALERDDLDAVFATAHGSVAALVHVILDEPPLRDRALKWLPLCAHRGAPTQGTEGELQALRQTVLDTILWRPNDPPAQQEAGVNLLRDWWFGAASRWDYSGAGWARVLFLETRFARYWGNLLRFDLGYSTQYKMPVTSLILEKLKYSLTLSLSSLLLAYLISVPLGMFSARVHGSWFERSLSLFIFALYSLPSFFVATLLVRFLAKGQPGSLEWIPDGGFANIDAWRYSTLGYVRDVSWHVIAPIVCMTYGSFAALSRYAKSGLMNVMRSDYVRTARAKGLNEFMVTAKHAGRNGIIPVITLIGTTLPVVIGGAFIIEFIFSIPGFGLLTVNSIFQRDLNVIIGITLLVAVLTMIGILLSDLLYAVVDPRISLS